VADFGGRFRVAISAFSGLNVRPSGQVAQLVEQRIENPRVGSSILPLATTSIPPPFAPGFLLPA
jgi:hypothetical protein